MTRFCHFVPLVALSLAPFFQDAGTADQGPGTALALRAPWSEVTMVCLTPPPEPAGTHPNGGSCRVQSILPLGDIADTAWFVTRYRRSVRFRSEGVVDSITYDELALVGRPHRAGDGVFRWHLRRERDIEFLDSVTVTPGAAGVFLEFLVCLNSTGGCSREYLLHRGGRWQPVAQPYVAALARHLPAGYQLHKGQRLDLRTLRGVWPVAQPGDANCCPSYEIAFRVRLRGSTVELESVAPLRVIPGPP